MHDVTASAVDAGFLAGGSELAELVRAKDWSETPLGPVEGWPQSLRTAASLCLASNFPIDIIWGPGNSQIYNDGYRVICSDVHPASLGQDFTVTWASAWPEIGGPFARALAGETVFLENQRMFVTRNGYLEETFFTFSFSPIRDESGGIGGLFHPVIEATATMLAERRMRALRDLIANLGAAADVTGLAELAVAALAGFDLDLPFVLLYELLPGGMQYRLAAHHGLEARTAASPVILDIGTATPWPIAAAAGGPGILEVDGVSLILQGAGCGPYTEPPDRAFVFPVSVPGAGGPPLVAVVGVSPRLPLDDVYRGFYELIGASLAASLATVRAREDERRRAEVLAALDRAKTAFFANVSHEFRTPLTLMLGPLEELLAHADRLPGDEREQVALAHRNCLRLLKLVNSLLDFSRIEAGRVQASFEPTDIAAFTADLASNFRAACERAGLALDIDAQRLSEPVFLDREMWEKVVLNLLSNAFKFTFAGGIGVRIHPSAGGDAVEVTVSDTGAGIPAAELPRVFERFHRVEGARGRSFEGSGIGLALVQELVTLHGGTIRVASEPGCGSAFTITIPFGHAHLAADRLGSAALLASTATRASVFVEEALGWLPGEDGGTASAVSTQQRSLTGPAKPGGNVLLADDNADMRSYVGRLLTAEGFTVEAVADGETALAAARRATPDLVLSDVMMPGLDGFGLLREMRGDPRLRDIPVVLLSARAGEEARVEGLQAGADDYLVKPFAARELVARVSANLNLARDRREAALRKSEAQLRALNADLERQVIERSHERGLMWQVSPDLLSVIDREDLFESTNPAWQAVLGWSEDELGKAPWIAFVHPDDVDRSQAASKGIRGGKLVLRFENRYRHKAGGYRWLSWVCVSGGDKIYSSARDVTAEKHQAEALAQAEEALRQSQKMEAVGQLTGGIAHDFNNMLQAISGSLELMQRRLKQGRPNELPRYVDGARATVARAAALTHRLLAFARRQTLQPRPVDAGELIQGMEELIRHTVGPAIAVEARRGDRIWPVLCDPNQLESALLNLAINARDAMPDGGRLTIATRRLCLSAADIAGLEGAKPGEYVEIAVSDTGTGMDHTTKARAFEPFFTTKPTGEGSGLGLSQLYGFIQQSNGSVHLDSAPGQGTVVRLYLPRLDCESEQPDLQMLDAAPTDAGRGETVLLVEDEEGVRAAAAEHLRDLGYIVLEAADGPDALRLLRSGVHVDVLVTDVGLPGGMNGRQVADSAREHMPDLPVLFITGYAGVILHGQLAPRMEMIGKPFALNTLAARLRAMLDAVSIA
jgi:PAS domain S-box-containing protein